MTVVTQSALCPLNSACSCCKQPQKAESIFQASEGAIAYTTCASAMRNIVVYMYVHMLKSPFESLQIMANFGSSDFKADVQSLEADALQCIQEQVTQTPLMFASQVPHQCSLSLAACCLHLTPLCTQRVI